ncbi:MAG TPA: hypothetical protein VK582_24365 [Pyrinomonadaceae bacterium]|nr:hypothetical protein [Pyrinomonadaceae bacterium]
MLPQILQAPEYGTPVAALSIDGLGICCFNPYRQWEVAFLRYGHEFLVTVRKINQSGRILDQSPATRVNDLSLVEILVDDGSEAHFDDFPKGFFKAAPGFSRSDDESYDFRWAIDVAGSEVRHGSFLGFVESSQRASVTIVTVPNALFYTKRVTQESVIFAPTPSPAENGLVLGRTNEVIGAAIYASSAAEGGQILIRYAESGHAVLANFPMPYEEGIIYDISLTNMDQRGTKLDGSRALSGAYTHGDFDRFYDVINVSGPKQQIFAPPKSILRTDDGDCHTVGGGFTGDDLPSLMPLIEP